MDFDETIAALDSVLGAYVIVYAAPRELSDGAPTNFGSGFSARGVFVRDEDDGAAERRRISEAGRYGAFPDLNLGDAPLELYERQVTGYTFAGMNSIDASAGFILWRHSFLDSQWLQPLGQPDCLWIRAEPVGVLVVAEFPGAPQRL